MVERSKTTAAESTTEGHAPRPMWKTPTLTEDSIVQSTRHMFSSGIDNYEATNPVQYGS